MKEFFAAIADRYADKCAANECDRKKWNGPERHGWYMARRGAAEIAKSIREADIGGSVGPKTLNDYAAEVHIANASWWHDIHTGEPLKRNVGELLMLTVSELAEAMEGHRKGLMDDKLPHRQMFEVELADAVIRILDICAGMGLDLHGAYVEKMAYNRTRADHSVEARKAEGGKKY